MCEISDNTCNNSGGGVEFALEDFGDPGIMELCRVHNNTAELMSGGGVHVGWFCILRNSLIHHNQSSSGGGIYATSGSTVRGNGVGP
jgi:predicted outer membrane repeat protein